jgi:prepilin-type N-terminal cleavage/methylation domain-containing protein
MASPRRPPYFSNGSHGFTLVELALAMIILGLALLPVFSLLTSGMRQAQFNEEQALASFLADQILERYRDASIDWLEEKLAGPDAASKLVEQDPLLTPKNDPLGADFMRVLSTYSRSIAFERRGPAKPQPSHSGTLTARVRWQDARRKAHEVVRKLLVVRERSGETGS